MHYIIIIFILFLTLNSLTAIFMIINERRQPEKTLIWLLILAILGPIGFIIYSFFGKDVRRKYLNKTYDSYNENHIESINNKMQKQIESKYNLDVTKISNLISKLNFCPITSKNKIQVFSNGLQKFSALKKELLNAKHHIHLEYFIVRDDSIGNEIKNILIKKSLEGVKVRFMMDKIGCRTISKKYVHDLIKNGVEVLFYSYMSTPFLKIINTQINYRNHRKIVIIDGHVSFTGGINIGDEYLGLSSIGNWRDTHIMIKGECTRAIQHLFITDYLNLKSLNKENIDFNQELDKYFPNITEKNITYTQIIKSGPNLSYNSMILPLLKLLSMAKKTIRISTPYFIPSTSFLNLLKICILSGIEVIINFPGKPDHRLVYFASRTYLKELVDIGAKVYFYDKNSFLHSKFIIIDDCMVTVGSTNMDIRSFELNHELNLMIYDKEICTIFLDNFKKDIENSTLSKAEDFTNINKLQVFGESISRLFSSLL